MKYHYYRRLLKILGLLRLLPEEEVQDDNEEELAEEDAEEEISNDDASIDALLAGKGRELATEEDWIEAGVIFEEDASTDNGDDVSERDECDNCESSHVDERDEYDDSSDSSECNGYSESSDERPTR